MQHILYKGGLNAEIIELFKQTFTDSEGEKEGEVIGALVKRFLENTPEKDILVFLTLNYDQLVGGVIFSRLTFEESKINTWLLSPAAVVTSKQRTGLGQDLIKYAHEFLKRKGVQQVVTYGDINFYSKVGYQPVAEEVLLSPFKLTYPEGWIAQSLEGETLKSKKGKSYCEEALNVPELW
jgi:predicted N-acetyltransferase YhbS